MTETANSMALRLMREVEDAKKPSYAKGEVKTVLNSIAQAGKLETLDGTCRAPVALKTLRRGDVFIAKVVGGKVRPWITLNVGSEIITAVSMSSGDSAPGMKKSQCRFWPSSWVGSTISAFDMEFASKEVTRPYTNLVHLDEIEASIASNMGMRLVARNTSLSAISEKYRRRRAGA